MENSLTPNQSEFLLYVSQGGDIKVDVLLHDETVWLTQKGMQELFEKAKSTISEHIKNVFDEGELDEKVVVRDFRTTSPHGAIEGKTQENTVKYYNLDVIISSSLINNIIPSQTKEIQRLAIIIYREIVVFFPQLFNNCHQKL